MSEQALQAARARLGARADAVRWLRADALELRLPEPVDLWHDRAVFHFLTKEEGRAAYVRSLLANLRDGGHVVMATFALDGPPRCSGLEVARYSPQTLSETLGASFERLRSTQHTHPTPSGGQQRFTYALFRWRAPTPGAQGSVEPSPR